MVGPRCRADVIGTVRELMEGKGIERPSSVAAFDDTFKKAPESKKKQGRQSTARKIYPKNPLARYTHKHTDRVRLFQIRQRKKQVAQKFFLKTATPIQHIGVRFRANS